VYISQFIKQFWNVHFWIWKNVHSTVIFPARKANNDNENFFKTFFLTNVVFFCYGIYSRTLQLAIRLNIGTLRSAQRNGMSSDILLSWLMKEFFPIRFLLQSKKEILPWYLKILNDCWINLSVSSVLARFWGVCTTTGSFVGSFCWE